MNEKDYYYDFSYLKEKAFFIKKDPTAIAPVYKTDHAACADLAIPHDIVIKPKSVDVYWLGLIVIPPAGYHWQVYLRSSTGINYPGVILANCVGMIDGDYIGPEDELGLILLNNSDNTYSIKAGTRLAQMRLVKDIRPISLEECSYDTIRQFGSRGGLGSTGK